MNLQHLFNQVVSSVIPPDTSDADTITANPLDSIRSALPGGLAGGVAAGGVMALLMGNKSALKLAGKAATFGGTALLGGLAYKAYQNWQGNQSPQSAHPISAQKVQQAQNMITEQTDETLPALHITLIKSMIAAAKADGHIDPEEQQHIYDAVEKMQLSSEEKAVVFDCLQREINIEELANAVTSTEHKAEVYLASYLAINPDHPAEQAYLNNLAMALDIPADFTVHLQQQANAGFEPSRRN